MIVNIAGTILLGFTMFMTIALIYLSIGLAGAFIFEDKYSYEANNKDILLGFCKMTSTLIAFYAIGLIASFILKIGGF